MFAVGDESNRCRDLFLGALAAQALHSALLARAPMSLEHTRVCATRLHQGLRDVFATGCDISIPAEVRDLVVEDPLMLGWAYQFWNEDERDASTWAISRQGDTRSPLHAMTAATQIFTEDYMARFVVRRVVNLVRPKDGVPTVFDPACGAGHLLVHALRELSCGEFNKEPIEAKVAGLYGCDVDASVVELCRVILLLEAIRLGASDSDALAKSLERTIVAVSYEHGALRRDNPHSICARRYSCVVTNPPYIGRRKLTSESRAFLDVEYPASSMDLCAAFMQRCVEFVEPHGALGLITVDKWLRLRGYEQLRSGGPGFSGLYKALSLDVVCELGQRAFSQVAGLHDGVGISLLTARAEAPLENHTFHFVSFADARCSREKARMLKEWESAKGATRGSRNQAELLVARGGEHFLAAPGIPQALSAAAYRKTRDCAHVVVGLQTSDDRRFVRYVWNVPPDKERWKVHSKGGGYGRWFGLNRFVIDWRGGRPFFESNPKSGLSVERWFGEEGWTYTWFANGSLGLRLKERGWSFGRAAASGVFCDDLRLIGFLNSRVASLAARRIGGKAQLPEGVVRNIPIPNSLERIEPSLVSAAVEIKKKLVSFDLTDVAFVPGQAWDPRPVFYLEALLLLVEGALERQALDAVEATSSEQESLDAAMGRPGAWSSARHFDDDTFWRAIPAEFRSLRKVIQQESSSDGASDHGAGISALETLCKEGRSSNLHQRGFPVTSTVEWMCRGSGLHPCDVARFLDSRLDDDPVIRRAYLAPALGRKIVEEVLRVLGHTWWSENESYQSTSHRAYAHSELVRHLSQGRLSVEDERLLGCTISQWLHRKLPAALDRMFFRSSPLDISVRDEPYYTHRWATAGANDVGGMALSVVNT